MRSTRIFGARPQGLRSWSRDAVLLHPYWACFLFIRAGCHGLLVFELLPLIRRVTKTR